MAGMLAGLADASSAQQSCTSLCAGAQFEQQILKQQQNSTKFSFLKPGDPYNAYYKYKVQLPTCCRAQSLA